MRKVTRRAFVVAAARTGAGLALGGCAATAPAPRPVAPPAAEPTGTEPLPPTEALMRQHGVLARILLVYDEGRRRLEAPGPVSVEPIASAAAIVRRFAEDYHAALEEKYVFPRLVQSHRLVPLVTTLRDQHRAGRRLTDDILRLATQAHMRGASNRRRLADSLRVYTSMSRAHMAREDTIVFPAFRGLLPEREYEQLADTFEERDLTAFGRHGFEHTVNAVADLEQALGIHDLARLTPG